LEQFADLIYQKEVAQWLNMSQSQLSRYLSGYNYPGRRTGPFTLEEAGKIRDWVSGLRPKRSQVNRPRRSKVSEECVSFLQAAKICGCSIGKIHSWVDAGFLNTFVPDGYKKPKILQSELNRFTDESIHDAIDWSENRTRQLRKNAGPDSIKTWADCGQYTSIVVFARLSGRTASQVKTLCLRGMPHRRPSPESFVIDVDQARKWLAESPFASGRMVSSLELSELLGGGKTTIRKRARKQGWNPPKHYSADGRVWYCIDDLSEFYRNRFPLVQKRDWKRSHPGTNADPTAHAWIYEIIDPKDGQAIYIGFTAQKSYKTRWQQHIRDLEANRHYNRQLQNVWNKRDKPLIFKVIADGMSGLMSEREKRAIAELKEKIGNRCCNHSHGGECGGLSQATKDKISEISRKKWQDPEYRKRYEQATGRKYTGEHTKEAIEKRRQRHADRKREQAIAREKRQAEKEAAKYSKDDLVCVTHKSEAYFPAMRDGSMYWCSIDKDRMDEVCGKNWCITDHNGRGHARLKTNQKGKSGQVLNKPWDILAAQKNARGVVLLP